MRFNAISSLKKKAMENVSDTAMSVLGVSLLLMFPKNFTYLPYWVAVGSWCFIDSLSEDSKIQKLSELI